VGSLCRLALFLLLALLASSLTWNWKHGLMSSSSQMVGQNVAMPVALSPCGFGGMMWPNGEAHAARAAEKFGVPFSRKLMCPARLPAARCKLRQITADRE